MHTYVALIRGIGPGNPNKTNEKLRGVLEGLGFANVTSVISSGNIIFESTETDTHKLEDMIETAWPRVLGFQATTIVRSYDQLQEMLHERFFDGMTHAPTSYLLITLFKRPKKPAFELPFQPPGKPYVVVGYSKGTLFTVTDNTVVQATDLMAWLEKQFGKDITSRTPLTIERIAKKMQTK